MQIDWITVLAQLVNFGLLIWLLQKLLYSPILKLIAEREAEISARIDAATAKSNAADEERQRLADARNALEASRERIIADAVKAGEAKSQALSDQARETARKAHTAWQKDMQLLTQTQTQQLARNAVDQLEDITARCLHDLADETMQNAMARQLIGSLQQAPAGERKRIGQNLREGPVTVISNRKSSAQTQKTFKEALHEIAGETIAVEFQTDETLSPGLVLNLGHQTFAWTIDAYLADFMRHVRETIETGAGGAGTALSKISAS